ncbi:hypothetical protein BH11PSE12_BH11PSE12_07780 [soil metagenome]
MYLYALSDEINRLHAELSTVNGTDRLVILVRLAWYLRQSDSQQALLLADEAEALLGSSILRIEQRQLFAARLALTRAEVSALFCEFDRAEQQLADARTRFSGLNDKSGEGDSFLVEVIVALEQGDTKRAMRSTRAAVSCFERNDDVLRQMLAEAWYLYLKSFFAPEAARARINIFLVKIAEEKHPALAALVAAAQGELLFSSEMARSSVMYSQACELAQQAGLTRLAIMSTCNAGVGFQKLGDLDETAACYDRAVSRARQTGWPAMIAFSLMRLGELLRHLNRFEQSEQVLQEALRGFVGSKNGLHIAIAYAELGNTLLLRDMPKEAAACFETAIHLYREAGSMNNLAEHLISQARALSAAGEQFAALRAIEEARVLMSELASTSLQVDLREALAAIHRQHSLTLPAAMSAPNVVLHYLEEAVTVGHPVDAWQVPSKLLLSLAEAWSQAGDGQKAFDYAKQAIAADQRERSKQAENLATLMQVKHETERAKAESIHHQQMAAASMEISQTLDLLSKVGQEITADLNFENVCHILQRHLGSLLNASNLCIWIIEAETQVLTLSYRGKNGVASPVTQNVSERNGQHAALCIAHGGELLLEIERAITEQCPHYCVSEHEIFDIGTALFGPLIVGEHALGVMAIQAKDSAVYSERQRLIFRSLCAYGAIALDNAHAYDILQKTQSRLEQALQELEKTSLTDPLTGLKNRRFLMQNIDADVALSLRHYQTVASDVNKLPKDADLLMFLVDLDHFKQVNDKYGHAAGDAVLVQIRERLQQVFRDSDYLIRWGGEEFLIVARATSRDIAEELAERVRLVVAEKDFHLEGDLYIAQTCSVGFACFPFVVAHPRAITWQDVVDIADIALYAVKHAGRNGWVGLRAEEHAWPELLLCTLKSDPQGAIINRELTLSTNKSEKMVLDALAKKQIAA